MEIDLQFFLAFTIGGLAALTATAGYYSAQLIAERERTEQMESALLGFLKKIEDQRKRIDADEQERWELKQEKLEQDARDDY